MLRQDQTARPNTVPEKSIREKALSPSACKGRKVRAVDRGALFFHPYNFAVVREPAGRMAVPVRMNSCGVGVWVAVLQRMFCGGEESAPATRAQRRRSLRVR